MKTERASETESDEEAKTGENKGWGRRSPRKTTRERRQDRDQGGKSKRARRSARTGNSATRKCTEVEGVKEETAG